MSGVPCGVDVLKIKHFVATPFATRLLADLRTCYHSHLVTC